MNCSNLWCSFRNILQAHGIDTPKIISYLLPVFIFSLGLLSSWILTVIKRKRERALYQKSLLFILDDFALACLKQSKMVAKSIENVSLIKGNDFIISYVPVGTLAYLSKVDMNIFMQNFMRKKNSKVRSKSLSKLFETIDHISDLKESKKDFVKSMTDAYKQNESVFKECVEGLRKVHDKYGLKIENKEPLSEGELRLCREYFRIFTQWIEDHKGQNDFESLYNYIVKQMLNLNSIIKDVPLIQETNDLALRAEYAFENIKRIDSMFIAKFRDFSFSHRTAYRVIKVVVNILRNT